MTGSTKFDEIRAQRFEYLRAVYDETDGMTGRMVQMNEIGAKLGFDNELTDRIVNYLTEEGLLDWAALGGLIELTHWGLQEVEKVLSVPYEPTAHFLPLVVAENVIQVATMTNSQVQQGTAQSRQTALGSIDVESLRAVIADTRAIIGELDLVEDDQHEIEAELDTIDVQLSSPRPKQRILRESLTSVRSVLEGAAGGGLVAGAPQLAHALEKLGTALGSLPL